MSTEQIDFLYGLTGVLTGCIIMYFVVSAFDFREKI